MGGGSGVVGGTAGLVHHLRKVAGFATRNFRRDVTKIGILGRFVCFVIILVCQQNPIILFCCFVSGTVLYCTLKCIIVL